MLNNFLFYFIHLFSYVKCVQNRFYNIYVNVLLFLSIFIQKIIWELIYSFYLFIYKLTLFCSTMTR